MQWSSQSATFASLKAHKVAVLGALVVVTLPVGYAASEGGATAKFVAAALANPLDILAGRSPGERMPGALAQSKPRKQLPSTASQPGERVLSNVRTRPIAPVVAPKSAPSAAAPGMVDATPPSGGVLGIPTPFAPVASIGGIGGGILPASSGFVSGGGAVGTPAGNVLPEVPAVVAAVPEPNTWVMMLAGFLAMAVTLRSRRRACLGSERSAPQG